MSNKQFYESEKQKENGLLTRVTECVQTGKPIGEKLQYDLMYAKKTDVSWELFYKILEVPGEAETGWNAANVACLLLDPAIRKLFSTYRNKRVNEKYDEDFLSNVRLEIAKSIPGYDREKSQFPHYVGVYLSHVGYVYDKDASAYMEKKKGIRIFNTGSLQKNDDEEKNTGDPYAQTKSSFVIEEELEKREKERNSKIFSNVVIQKKSTKESQEAFKDSVRKREQKEQLLRNTNEITKKIEKLKQTKDVSPEEKEKLVKKLESKIKQNKSDIKDIEKVINKDVNQSFVNACYWSKFLGGVSKFPDKVKDEFYESVLEEER